MICSSSSGCALAAREVHGVTHSTRRDGRGGYTRDRLETGRPSMRLSLFLLLALACALPAAADPRADAKAALHALFAAEFERSLSENPVGASMRGDRRWNDQWGDSSIAAIEKRQAADRAALDALKAIDRGALDETDQLSYDVFAWQLEAVDRRLSASAPSCIPLNQRGGVQTLRRDHRVLRSRRSRTTRTGSRACAASARWSSRPPR
jgi:hypothetical protein